MRANIAGIGSVIFVMAVFISCVSISAEAATPQEGWYVLEDEQNSNYRGMLTTTIDGITYACINNNPHITTNWIDLKTVKFTETLNLGTGNYLLYEKCYVGSSLYDWYIDQDWIILAAVTNDNDKIVFLDKNWLPSINMPVDTASYTTDVDTMPYITYSKGWCSNGTIYSRIKNTSPDPINFMGMSFLAYKLDYTIDSQFNLNAYEASGYYVNKININDLVCVLNKEGTSRIALVYLCPVDKLPIEINGGDRWPYVPPINVNILSDVVSEWEAKQLSYSNMLNSLNITNTTDAIATKATENTLNAINAGSLGQFESEIGIPSATTSAWFTTLWWIPKIFAIMCAFGVLGIFIRRSMHD